MTPFVSDPDFTLYVGDARAVLGELADGSVDCVVTSPPYWGLRDYGTGDAQLGLEDVPDCLGWATGERCGCCFVCSIVDVFREVRRVLAPHGTLWLNLGDSYSSNPTLSRSGTRRQRVAHLTAGRVAGLKVKDLVGVPWRVALALQAAGWWLRSDVIWSKPNVMPESVTDRPTKAHEYVFLLARSARYYFDADAVRDSHVMRPQRRPAGRPADVTPRPDGQVRQGWSTSARDEAGVDGHPLGRNVRTVWEITTKPYKGAHFATFPPELVERCVSAGCPLEVCAVCGKPRVRIVEKGEPVLQADTWSATGAARFDAESGDYIDADASSTLKHVVPRETVGWTDCGHGSFRPGVVLDPFMGSGTTAHVARSLRRHVIGVELNPEYAALAADRLSQQSLLADSTTHTSTKEAA